MGATAPVILSIGTQPPNTLLHDGHAWHRTTPARILSETAQALETAASAGAAFLVHASYAFLQAAGAGAQPGDLVLEIAAAALEAEAMVLRAPLPSCVVRLGYTYGPEYADLRSYRLSFRTARPYWAGPAGAAQHHIHSADAAAALLAAAGSRPAGQVLYASDGRPDSFRSFMDDYGRMCGNPLPGHIPGFLRPVAHLVVAEEHMQLVELPMPGPAVPVVPGFQPRFRERRAGFAQVFESWRQS